jgi:hypothetical protein
MELTYDEGIIRQIIERRGLPFNDNEEPRVIQVVRYDETVGLVQPVYGVVFEGEPEAETGVTVWAAE